MRSRARQFLTGAALGLAVVLGVAAAAAWAGSPLDGPVPPPVHCLTYEVDGVQTYHVELAQPATTAAERKAAKLRFGQELAVRGILSGNEKMRRDGERLVADATDPRPSKDVYGFVCYVLQAYCDPGCTGQGCMIVGRSRKVQ